MKWKNTCHNLASRYTYLFSQIFPGSLNHFLLEEDYCIFLFWLWILVHTSSNIDSIFPNCSNCHRLKMDVQALMKIWKNRGLSMIIAKLLLSILVYSPQSVQDFLQKSLTFLFLWGFFKPFVEHVLKGLTFFHGWLQYPLRARTGQLSLALQRFFITWGTTSLHFDTTDRCWRLSCSFPKDWLKYQCELLQMAYNF